MNTKKELLLKQIDDAEKLAEITPFRAKVFRALLEIPCGETRTYKQLGQMISCRSAQAIGQALKHNPFAPEVPCHRIVRSDGTLGGFMGQSAGEAIERKRSLLRSEGVDVDRLG